MAEVSDFSVAGCKQRKMFSSGQLCSEMTDFPNQAYKVRFIGYCEVWVF